MTQLETYYVEAEIPGRPIAWARTADANGRRITPARYRAWKELAVGHLAIASRFRRMTGEVSIVIDLHPDRVAVKVAALDELRRPGTSIAGDVDNYAKAVLDALQAANVLGDDKQATEVLVRINPNRKV
jgi:Holliday junction resolvase RusA-like endonuclease